MLGFGLVYVALLYGIKFVYPSFDMSIRMGHAKQFTEEEARNWIQIFVQRVEGDILPFSAFDHSYFS